MNPAWLALPLLACACAAVIGVHAEPVIIYNPSDSVPSGFYLRADGPPRRGDFVTVAAVDVAPEYAALRGYADFSDRFLKRIAAVGGQRVCATSGAITIDDALVASRVERDGEGRLLPTWRGCRTLAADEVFLLGDTEDSFDGRYWGPISAHLISGAWKRI